MMSNRSRTDSSATTSIDPFHYQALQDTNEALKSEVHRLARADEENTTKLKIQVSKILSYSSDIFISLKKDIPHLSKQLFLHNNLINPFSFFFIN